MNRTERLSRRSALARMLVAGAGAAGLSACGSPARSGAAEERRKPNFLFVLADDLGWADLGCYGNAFIETPVIDRLAAEGMRFTDAYAAPVCSPTRSSIMTGQDTARTGIYDFIPGHWRPYAKLVPPPNRLELPPEQITLAEALAPGGYVASSIGKWHLGLQPTDQGFVAPPKGDEGLDALPDPFVQKVDAFAKANPGKQVGPLTRQAVQFMAANRDRPFLCFLSHNAVHIVCQARDELVRKYEAKAKTQETPIYPVYAGMAEAMDESVGLCLETLDHLRLADRTVVIFVSDNGGLIRMFTGEGPRVTTNAPLRAEKGTLYEGGIRVPLIVRWPGTAKAGSVCRWPVISNDFLPTMLAMADLAPLPGQVIDGVSLVPLLKGADRLDRNTLYWYYPTYHHSTPAVAVREGDWKLIEFFEDGRLELYNLAEDIGEAKNLADTMREKAQALRTKLHAWLTSLNAPLPEPNPDHDPAKAAEWGQNPRVPAARKAQPKK
ncbi:MAG: sulfatase [Planctomycetes bacterium]|nr:sulfatase [Planctomycetota bacterium]